MIPRYLRSILLRIIRWHHLAHARDLEFAIRHHERMLAALPTEIRRLHEVCRWHRGRAATCIERRNPVNYTLGGRTVTRRGS